MSMERYSRTIPASGRIDTSRGNVMVLLTATGAVNLRAIRDGSDEGFNNVTGGVTLRRVKSWDNMIIVGAPGVTAEYAVGTENVERDETVFNLQAITVTGIATFNENPAATVASPDDNALPAATTENIAANLLRRRIIIGCLSTNTVGFRVQAVGANDASGIEVQPGMYVELKTTASLDIRNNDGAVATSYYIFEEA